MRVRTIAVGEGKHTGDTHTVIQRAVDELAAAGGGTAVVLPGVYRMHDALHLRSRVHVVGRPGAILRKVPSVTSPLLDYVGYGHYEVSVAEPEKFPVGTGVHVLDDDSGGFYTTVGTVTGRQGERLFIHRMLNHDYHPNRSGRVVSVYALVEADGIEDASIDGLTIDGNSGEETFTLNACRGSGVFIIGSARLAVRNVEVYAYRGDGIGFQQSTDILVERCHVHGNTGNGLHPGSGTVRYVIQDNRLHDNGGCGIFYCLRTSHSRCCRNEIRDNAAAGISIGERDSDHLIEENRISGSGGEGIVFRPPHRRSGDRTVLLRNEIGPNGTKTAGPEVTIAGGLADVHVLENSFTPGHGPALSVGQGCCHISFAGNKVSGRKQRPEDVAGAAGDVSFSRPARLPDVGPAALPLDGARHLAVAKLEPWDERRIGA
jgi:hypothetical protein